jgi:hypothetical protein
MSIDGATPIDDDGDDLPATALLVDDGIDGAPTEYPELRYVQQVEVVAARARRSARRSSSKAGSTDR